MSIFYQIKLFDKFYILLTYLSLSEHNVFFRMVSYKFFFKFYTCDCVGISNLSHSIVLMESRLLRKFQKKEMFSMYEILSRVFDSNTISVLPPADTFSIQK